MQIPTTMVTIEVIEGKEEFVVKSQVMMLGEAINTVCLEYLAQTAPSWKIALGASGTFTFDTNKMNIVMVFGKRIIRRTHQAEARHAHLKKETATVMLGRICYLGLNSNSRIFGNKIPSLKSITPRSVWCLVSGAKSKITSHPALANND